MWPFGNGKLTKIRKARKFARIFRAKYDAAVTNSDNTRYWANADGLSADAAASTSVRQILRDRARYEAGNNCYAKGIILTLANDVVGTGPRLQMLTPDIAVNRTVEQLFMAWASKICLPEKLRTMRMAKAVDGEAFAILTANPKLDSPVKLDLQLVEADRVTTSTLKLLTTKQAVDGIEFDRYGNPTFYSILQKHPGATDYTTQIGLYDRILAEAVIHWFRIDRPGQHRGIPEITPALPLFSQLRRYTLAVIAAAETAADFAGVLQTDAPADGIAAAVEPMDVVELEKRMATVLPGGWKLGQIKAEQPATSYAEFKKEILNEIARVLNMPFNVAAGNSSGYNYASGRLDHQTYFKSIRVDQRHLAAAVLDRLLEAWMREAILVSDLLPLPIRTMSELPHQWFWDGQEHADPIKEAKAQDTRLKNHTTTYAHEYGRSGKDWEVEFEQRAREQKRMNELGLKMIKEQSNTLPT